MYGRSLGHTPARRRQIRQLNASSISNGPLGQPQTIELETYKGLAYDNQRQDQECGSDSCWRGSLGGRAQLSCREPWFWQRATHAFRGTAPGVVSLFDWIRRIHSMSSSA